MEVLSGETLEEYFKAMDDEIQSLTRRDTWEIVSRTSVADHNILPGTWSINCKRKSYSKTSKLKALYFVRGHIQNRLSPKPLNSYSAVVQRATVSLMFIFQCILGLQSQSIDFKNSFAQADIPSGEPFFIEILKYFKSYGEQGDVVSQIKLNPVWSSQSGTPMV